MFRWFQRPHQLSVHLAMWFAVGAVAPLLGLGMLLAERLAESTRQRADQHLSIASQSLAHDVQTLMEGKVRALESLAGVLQASHLPLDAQSLAPLLAEYRHRSGNWAVLYVADSEGRSYVADPPLLRDGSPTAGRDYSDRDYFRAVRATKKTAISNAQVGKASGVPNVQIAVPLFDSRGEWVAYLCGSLDLSAIQARVDETSALLPGGHLMVKDERSRVLAHIDRQAQMRNLDHVALFAVSNVSLRSGPDEVGAPARASVTAVTFGGLTWSAAAYLAQETIDGEARATRWSAVGAAAGSLTLTIWLCVLLAARISRPIREVASAAQRFGRGERDITVVLPSRHSPQEVQQLISAVNQMAGERHELENELHQRAADLARANTELGENIAKMREAQARAAASDRMATVGVLASGVAHEINNPTAYVRANLSFSIEELGQLKRSSGNEKEARILEEVLKALTEAHEGTERIARIVADLKVFSPREGAEKPKPFDLGPVIESAIAVTGNQLRHRANLVRDLRLHTMVNGVAARVSQVLLNLLVNAVQALPETGSTNNRITITTREEGPQAVIEIEDTGCGISPENLPRIFHPFFTTKPVGTGTGMGLAICRQLVDSMGGTLSARSTVGKGSVFELRLPLADAPSRPLESRPRVPTLTPCPHAPKGQGRVLVIDDEPAIRVAISRVLRNRHEIREASSAAQALTLLRQGEQFNLVLCDVMMPERSGIELLADLQAEFPHVAERLVFLTGGAFEANAKRLLSDSKRPCLEKPFDADSLRALAREWCDAGTALRV